MAIVRWDPMSELRTLTRRMEQALESLTAPLATIEREPLFGGMFAGWPPVDVYEDKEEIVLRAEVPGMDQKDLEVVIDDGTLTLRGQRRLYKEDKRENYQRIESSYGTFSRSFSIPTTIDRDKVRAELKQGVLEVHIPKREGAKGKTIPIHA